MEEHELELSLRHSRARLRSLLVPDPQTGQIEADVFPRSVAMRALLAALPVLATVATRNPVLKLLVREVGSRFR
jgi:hypothetical protein